MQIKRNGWGARGGLFENLEFDGLQIGTLMFFRQFSVFFRPEPVVPTQIGLLVRANWSVGACKRSVSVCKRLNMGPSRSKLVCECLQPVGDCLQSVGGCLQLGPSRYSQFCWCPQTVSERLQMVGAACK